MRRANALLIPIVATMIVGCIGCSGDGAANTSSDDPAVPPGVVATIDGFNEAGSVYDTASMRTYLTDDFTWQSTGPIQNREGFLSYVDAYWERLGFRWEVTGERDIHREDESYVVEEPGVATAMTERLVGTTVYRMVEMDDTWLIAEVRWVEDTASETTG
ncbi:hypothetical protein ACFLQ7_04110 [Actinomycetota bacterium]